MRTFIEEIISIANSVGAKKVLDCGCGHCSVTSELYKHFEMTGIDLNEKDLIVAKRYYQNAYLLDVRDALKHFGENSFDAVMSLDVLEHFVKEESINILKDAEKIASMLSIHFVPADSFTEYSRKQQHCLCGQEGQAFEDFEKFDLQAHRCQWEKEDFEKFGYSLIYYGEPFRHWLAVKKV